MEYILTLTFVTENGSKSSLTITDVKSSITSEQANELMDVILSNDIFETKNGAFISKADAKLTERKITEFSVE